jgi:hypothetical protein
MWCITAFTRGNGPLRVIPGTLNYSPGLRLAVTSYLSAPAKAEPGVLR